jgi:GNAT superfamily N-acetyltransferase
VGEATNLLDSPTNLLDEQADGEGRGEKSVYIWIGKVTGNSLKVHEEWEGEGVGRVFIPYSAAVSVEDVLDRIRLACGNEPHTLVA